MRRIDISTAIGNNLRSEKAYWECKFDGFSDYAFFEHDYLSMEQSKYSIYTYTIEESVAAKLLKVSKKNDHQLHILLLSTLCMLLAKYSSAKDSLIFSPVYNHGHDDRSGNQLLILRMMLNKGITFKSLASDTKNTVIEANKNKDYPHEMIMEAANIAGRYDTVMSLSNIQDSTIVDNFGFNVHFIFERDGGALRLNLKYNIKRFDQLSIKRIVKWFESSLKVAFESSTVLIDDLNIVRPEEEDFILNSSSGRQVNYPNAHILNRLNSFKESKECAAVHENLSLNYKEIHQRSDNLAHRLVHLGIGNESVVGVIMLPSIDFVVSVLAVLKSGGCFMPVDPAVPKSRMAFMLSDSRAEMVITNTTLIEENKGVLDKLTKCKTFNIDGEELVGNELNSSLPSLKPEDIAYIIYTSGSTGEPKGVQISHVNLNNYISWATETYIEKDKVSMPFFTSVGFDLTITSIFLPLASGGTIRVYAPREKEIALNRILDEDKVDLIKLTPSHLRIMAEREFVSSRLKTLIVGGELLEVLLAQNIHQLGHGKLRIFNEYGPTEATVGCSIYKYDPEQKFGKSVLIGKAAPNCQLLVLDKAMQPVTYGFEGEMFIGGLQVGRYINDQLTNEKFVGNPFGSGLIYKTGDVCKVYEDGNIEYIRRIDDQVKLNGYRIEPGEIEAKLLEFTGIDRCKVILRNYLNGGGYLAGYYLSDENIAHEDLTNYLIENLPAYMVPSHLMKVEKFPLTVNGKLDENKLPGIEVVISEQVLPNNEIEQLLLDVISTVLGVDKVGMIDNFFEMGGDSIKIIQLSARLLKKGYKLKIRDIYDHPVASELIEYMVPSTAQIEQGNIEGQSALNPIQKWFYTNFQIKEHYNQSVMLHFNEEVELTRIETIFNELYRHHDALRMILTGDRKHPVLINKKDEKSRLVKLYDLKLSDNWKELLEEKANAAQSSLSLSDGPLIKVRLFRSNDGDRLLIVAHHLVVDGVSWRILLDDFITLYDQKCKGEKLELPPKTHSFLEWNNALQKYAHDIDNIETERDYWTNIDLQGINSVPHDYQSEESSIADRKAFTFSLSPNESDELLRSVNWVYRTEINDLLMTGFMKSIQSVFGIDKIAINLEGHGREDILENIDISRTVGWFTSMFPVILDVSQCREMSSAIKTVKEQLHSIPSKGVGYGIIKYLSDFDSHPIFELEPSISFNYLGSFEDTIENEFFKIATERSGDSVSLLNRMMHDIDILGSHVDGTINMTIYYNGKRFKKETIEKLGQAYQSFLHDIILHCNSCEKSQPTPSDFTHNNLTMDQADYLSDKYNPEDIYPLTPMQTGLYFHSVSNPDSFTYNTQFGFTLKGSLDVDKMKMCFNHILRRYQNLRANFLMDDGFSSPVQLIAKNKEIEFSYEDFSMNQDIDQCLHNEQQRLLRKKYDFVNDVLMRVGIFKIGPDDYKIYWYYHHILLDGWCLNILFKDILTIYHQLSNNKEIKLPKVHPYKNFIQWVQKANYEASKSYWSDYLSGFTQPSMLLELSESEETKSDASEVCRIEGETLLALERVATTVGCTMFTVIQALWSILLTKYSEKSDLVFGQVVSGRPNLEGSAEMVGLFINTIPKRVIINEETSFTELLKEIMKDDIESLDHHTCPLSDIIKTSVLGNALFDHVVVFENQYQLMDVESEMTALDFDITSTESYDPNEYDLSIFIHHRIEELSFEFRFNENKYGKDEISEIAGSLNHIAKGAVNAENKTVDDILMDLIDEDLSFMEVSFE